MKTIQVLPIEHEDKGHFRASEEAVFMSDFPTDEPCVVITKKDLNKLLKATPEDEFEIEFIED